MDYLFAMSVSDGVVCSRPVLHHFGSFSRTDGSTSIPFAESRWDVTRQPFPSFSWSRIWQYTARVCRGPTRRARHQQTDTLSRKTKGTCRIIMMCSRSPPIRRKRKPSAWPVACMTWYASFFLWRLSLRFLVQVGTPALFSSCSWPANHLLKWKIPSSVVVLACSCLHSASKKRRSF